MVLYIRSLSRSVDSQPGGEGEGYVTRTQQPVEMAPDSAVDVVETP